MTHFTLGQRNPEEMLYFERAWPKLSQTPDAKAEFSKSTVTRRTNSGLICASFYVSFYTNTTINKVSANTYKLNLEGPKMTACNGLENGYLDGNETPQSLKYRLTDTIFEEPEEFEVFCDGFNIPRKDQEPTYKPEYSHLYKVTKEGELGGTIPLFEDSICWIKFFCEKDSTVEEDNPVNLYL